MMIEFALKDPPVGANAKEHSAKTRKDYKIWKNRVGREANAKVPEDFVPTANPAIQVLITNYHKGNYHDVDNVIKPIFDRYEWYPVRG